MKIKLFDANVYLGTQMLGVYDSVPTASELLKKMDDLEIEKALVYHMAQFDYSPEEGNKMLVETMEGSKRLYGCWTVLPPQTEEVMTKDFFSRMKKNRIFALNVFPVRNRFLLNGVVFGSIFEEMIERSIPLVLSMREGGGATWEMIYSLLKEFPKLTCIITDFSIWGVDRYTFPLLEKYKNVYLESGVISLQEGSFEMTVRKYGAKRLVFGSGFPEKYQEASMLHLLHSNISEADKVKVGSGNMEALISKVQL